MYYSLYSRIFTKLISFAQTVIFFLFFMLILATIADVFRKSLVSNILGENESEVIITFNCSQILKDRYYVTDSLYVAVN